MAWLARDLDGSLFIYESKPYRERVQLSCTESGNYENIPEWMEDIILKGKVITWKDEPVEI